MRGVKEVFDPGNQFNPGKLLDTGRFKCDRDLRWSDVKTSPHVVLVNEAFVRRLLPQGEPLGRRIVELLGPGNDPWEIAGVIGDVHTKGLDQAPAPLMVVPLMQYGVPSLRLAARAAGADPMQLLAPLRSEVLALDKDLPLSLPQPLARIVTASVGERRFQMTLLGVFAMVALVLAALGIYGVMAYSVTQRSREIGIRMALGAARASVLAGVMKQGLLLTTIGLVGGLIGAIVLNRFAASLLFGVQPTDVVTMASVTATIAVVGAVACWIPAWRACRLSPTLVLRED